MRKFLYSLMLICGIIGILSLLYFPIFKFNDEKIKTNYDEYALLTTDNNYYTLKQDALFNQMDKDKQKEARTYAKLSLTEMHAIITADKTTLYNIYDYQVLNTIYLERHPSATPKLNKDSSKDAKDLMESIIIEDMGKDNFLEKKELHLSSTLNSLEKKLYCDILDANSVNYDSATDEEIKNAAISIAVRESKDMILDDLFLQYTGVDSVSRSEIAEDIDKNGFKALSLIDTYKKVILIDKAVWNQEEYKDLSFFKKIKAVQQNPNFYNPLPLLIISLGLLFLLLTSIRYIFKGLKGIRGRKYPRAFISSLLMAALSLLIILMSVLIKDSFYLRYHSSAFTRLYDLIRMADFGLLFYIYAIIFIYGTFVSIIGRFFKYGKKLEPKEDKHIDN